MWNNRLSSVAASDLFPQSPASKSDIRTTQRLESWTLTVPKGLQGGLDNYILHSYHNIQITVNTAHQEANCRKPHVTPPLSNFQPSYDSPRRHEATHTNNYLRC